MVKQVRITLEDQEHQKFLKYKNETWYDLLKRGVESSAYFPNDLDWTDVKTSVKHYLMITNEGGELK